MDLSRPEYPAMLDALQPTQATALLNDRVKHIGRINTEIADWLSERRRIEEQYSAALRKLAQRQPPGDSSDLGIFTTPWQKVVTSAAAMAESHQVLAQKIDLDIERPLRDFSASNREVQAMSTMQGNLQSLAKDYDSAQKKSDKMKDKTGRTGATKIASVSSEMDNASSQWSSQAPYVFEALQSLDETRCNHLRDVLTQFQTHEVDTVEKNRKTAENTLNSILNIETADEIKTFSIKNTGGGQGEARRRPERRQSRSQPSATLAPPTSSPAPDELTRERSTSVQEEKKGRLGGLKRLGTVMRRKSTQPSAYSKTSSSAAKSSSSNLAASTASNGDESNVGEPGLLQGWRPPSSGNFGSYTGVQESRPMSPLAASSLSRELQTEEPAAERSVDEPTSTVINGSSHQSDLAQLREPISLATPVVTAPLESTRDAEGFSVPATSMDPISQAEQEAASASDPSSSPFKVDIQKAPIAEESTDADSAMANMANTLRAQAAPPRRSGTNRGRRDVRNTVFVPTTTAEVPTAAEENTTSQAFSSTSPPNATSVTSPLQSIQSAAFASPPPLLRQPASETSDSQSIKSSRSTGTVGLANRHPNASKPGLNSSVIETFSVWLEHGNVTRSLVIGELALAYTPTSPTDLPDKTSIRLDNFSALEKVAPNPAFVVQSEDLEKPGEYTVDVAGLSRTVGSPNIAFKYQVHISEQNTINQAPIILTPSWKVEENQTSVILSYSLNSEFTSPISLSNVTLFIHLDANENGTGKPMSCQSKPAGTFSKERSMVYWRLDELLLSPGTPPQKVLARFATDGQAKPGKVEARWEIKDNSTSTLSLGSGLDVSQLDSAGTSYDPFADDSVAGTWKSVGSSRKLVSGTYTAT